MKTRKLLLGLLIVAVFVPLMLLTACASNAKSPSDADGGASDAGMESTSVDENTSGRKIIYTVGCNIEVDDVKTAMNTIRTKAHAVGGYEGDSTYESNTKSSKSYIRLHIPTEKLAEFTDSFEEYGNVKSQNKTSEDITKKYINTDTELKVLEGQLQTILDILGANPTLDKYMQYETRIRELQTKINTMKKQIADYDALIEYSTVHINLYGKGQAPKTIGYGEQFTNTASGAWGVFVTIFQWIGLALVAVAPFAAAFALIFFPVKYGRRAYRKKHPKERKDGVKWFAGRSNNPYRAPQNGGSVQDVINNFDSGGKKDDPPEIK